MKSKVSIFNDTFVLSPNAPKRWVRGVNIGGWLVLERYITPYMFSITDCHIQGDFCWFPGQLSAPSDGSLCHLYRCQPYRTTNIFGDVDYPIDEWNLAKAFNNETRTAEWLNHHFDRFVTEQDIHDLKDAGVTHLRVPLPHWILGDVHADEQWVAADRWKYFVRFLGWCRQSGLEVWPDIHTAPGSQNGFDNSGQAGSYSNCRGWSDEPRNVERSLNAIRDITARIVDEGYGDVVTGFGLLNEPFTNCDKHVYQSFLDSGLQIARQMLGRGAHVYASDMFSAKSSMWDGFWTDPDEFHHTYLDSHYYHVFAERTRALSPRQHIAFVCTNELRDYASCCYENHFVKSRPSQGIRRMAGEWSVATDALPVLMLKYIMDSIAERGIAADFDRQISPERAEFLRHFAQAQMVTYESADLGTSSGWFYWNFKMEGGGFAEWDYLQGIKDGWMPRIPPADTPSASVYGTCYDIIFRTNDTMDIIHEYPDPNNLPDGTWFGPPIDDDVVLSHGQSLLPRGSRVPITPIHHRYYPWAWSLLAVLVVGVALRFVRWKRVGKAQYTSLDSDSDDGISA